MSWSPSRYSARHINNYAEARALLGGKLSLKLTNNTYLKDNQSSVVVTLHETDIISYYPDGSVVLDSGGFRTMLTSGRIDDFGPSWLRLSSQDGLWFVVLSPGTGTQWSYLFADGLEIKTVDGHPVISSLDDATLGRAFRAVKAHNAVTRRAINAYVKAFEVPLETTEAGTRVDTCGDCWICCSIFTGPSSDTSHLLEHIREQYNVGSLALAALEEAGYPYLTIIAVRHPDMTRRALKKYLGRRLLVGGQTRGGRVNVHPDALTWYLAGQPGDINDYIASS